jgi:plastocyanin
MKAVLLLKFLFLLSLARIPLAADPSGMGGEVEGTVRYQPDPKRPWKLSRFYIRDPKSALLAEAVVALEGGSNTKSSPEHAASTNTIDQLNFQFVPEVSAIRAGDAVRIMNSDEALHNVMTADGGKPFNVNVAKGKELTQTFDRAGGLEEPVRLGCIFHGGMRAWIYVFDHPWFKVTENDGGFSFQNVPPGKYTIGLVHPAGKLSWKREVEITRAQKTRVDILLSPDNSVLPKESQN